MRLPFCAAATPFRHLEPAFGLAGRGVRAGEQRGRLDARRGFGARDFEHANRGLAVAIVGKQRFRRAQHDAEAACRILDERGLLEQHLPELLRRPRAHVDRLELLEQARVLGFHLERSFERRPCKLGVSRFVRGVAQGDGDFDEARTRFERGDAFEREERLLLVAEALVERRQAPEPGEIVGLVRQELREARARSGEIVTRFEHVHEAERVTQILRRIRARDGAFERLHELSSERRIERVGGFEIDEGVILAPELAQHLGALLEQRRVVRRRGDESVEHARGFLVIARLAERERESFEQR